MKKKNELEDNDIWEIAIPKILPFFSKIPNVSTPPTTTQVNTIPTSNNQQPAPTTNQTQGNLMAKKAIKSFSIRGSLYKKEEEIKQEEEQRLKALSQNESFTQEQLIRCWNNFIKGLTEKQILKNTMMSCKPLLEENFKISVHVDNSVQKEQLELELVALTNHLRENLKNGQIEIEIHINEMGENIKNKTTHEMFMELIEISPDFAKFVQNLKLEIE